MGCQNRVVLRFSNAKMAFELEERDLRRIDAGCTTVPTNRVAVQGALMHSFLKSRCLGGGDIAKREVFSIPGHQDKTDAKPMTTDYLRGPTTLLEKDRVRYLRLQMKEPVSIELRDGKQVPHDQVVFRASDPCDLFVIYSDDGACFMDVLGNIMYVYINELMLSMSFRQC
jgi:hypothetical protein